MDSGRAYNTVRNMRWGLARRAVALLGPFVIRMLLIQCLGADYLGLSTFYTSLLQVLNLCELGFASAVSYGMYAPLAAGDDRQAARYLVYLKVAYRWVGVAMVALGLLLVPALGLLVKGPVPADVNAMLAFLIYIANASLGYFLFAYKQTLLVASQRKDVVDRIGMMVLVVQFAVQAVLLAAAPNFYTYALAMPVCSVVANLAVSHAADRLCPGIVAAMARAPRLEAAERADMRTRIAGLVLQRACMVSRDPFASVAVSAFVGLQALACFGNYLMVATGVLGILGVLAQSMAAPAGNSVALESPQKNFGDLRLAMFLYALASIVCAAVMLALFQPFMRLWMGEENVLPLGFAVLMVVYFYIRTMGDVRTVYVDATGVWWKLRWRALAEAVVNVVLCVVLTRAFGLVGALAALTISLFALNFVYGSHLVFKLYFGLEKARAYYADHALYLAVGAAVCSATYAVAALVPADTVPLLLARGALAAAVAAALLFLAFFRTKKFTQAKEFLHRAIQMPQPPPK